MGSIEVQGGIRWISSSKRRTVKTWRPVRTSFLLQMRWRERGEIVRLVYSYLRREIDGSTLLARYVNWVD